MHDFLKKIAKKYRFLLIKEQIYKKEKEELYIKSKAAGIRAGKEIGILQVLRYNQQTLSAAKFKESARFFDFDGLNAKYPFNPLFEKMHEKADKDK